MKPMVIAVSGYSGAGKSTVVSHLSKRFNCAALFFDDYASRKDFPIDLTVWLKEGGNPNLIRTPLLRNDLIQLLNGHPVELVKGNGWAKEYGINHEQNDVQIIKPSPLLIVEEPFGREREEIKDLVDIVVYLNLEPEIALGRRIHDLIKYLRSDSEVLINLLDHFLYDYLFQGVRDMYVEIGKRVISNSDLIINANNNIKEIVDEISEMIVRK
jgi:uridine kinase